jgi:nicotinamidase/pyrazinamidase
MTIKKALIIVDLQHDFCPGGSLAVSGGDEIVPLANQLQAKFDLVVATQDWHPHDHVSFAANHNDRAIGDVIYVDDIPQVLWPVHCVQGTHGAAFHADFDTSRVHKIIHKGIDSKVDSYSAFYDNEHLRSTGLSDYLRGEGVEEVYIMGLATDYCVKYTALDAVHDGFKVNVITDGCRGVELKEGDIANAYAEMQAAGVKLLLSADIKKQS